MQLVLAQVSTLPAQLADELAAYAAAEFRQFEGWLTKLEEYLSRHRPEELRRLLEQHGMTMPVASFQGGLFATGPARDEAWSLFHRRLELCRQWQIGTLVMAADVVGSVDQLRAQQIIDTLRRAADDAARAGVRLALEFRAPSALLNNLQTTLAFVHQISHPYLGVCLDAVHFYAGPSKIEDLHHLRSEFLFHVQLADVIDVPRELVSDSHRILPGEGDVPVDAIVAALRRIGYRGTVSVELMNPKFWQVAPRQVAELAMSCLRRLF